MKAVILAAGEGTRLRPLTDSKPKPLVEVAGKPMLEHCFDSLADAGAESFVVVVGYMAGEICEAYGDEYDGMPITYAHQREQKGLAHALVQAEPYVNQDFLLMHGDNVFAESAHADLREVAGSDADAALLVEQVTKSEACDSAVALTDNDRVTDVVERADNPPSDLAVVGFYLLPPAVFEACRRTKPSDRGERELGDALSFLSDDCDVTTVRLGGDRVNVNTPEDIERAESMLNSD